VDRKLFGDPVVEPEHRRLPTGNAGCECRRCGGDEKQELEPQATATDRSRRIGRETRQDWLHDWPRIQVLTAGW
jgi:hypothetical protein